MWRVGFGVCSVAFVIADLSVGQHLLNVHHLGLLLHLQVGVVLHRHCHGHIRLLVLIHHHNWLLHLHHWLWLIHLRLNLRLNHVWSHHCIVDTDTGSYRRLRCCLHCHVRIHTLTTSLLSSHHLPLSLSSKLFCFQLLSIFVSVGLALCSCLLLSSSLSLLSCDKV